MSGADETTISVYDAGAADYAAKFGSETVPPWQQLLIDNLTPGSRVLDLGCGTGTASARLRDAGLVVDAMDASAGMAAEAQRLHGLSVQVAEFDDLTADGIYDAVLAQFSLLHSARADLPRHLAAIHHALRPEGLFVIGMKTGTGSARDGIGRFYTYVGEDELDAMMKDAGFTLTSRFAGADEGFDGTVAPWIVLAAHA